MHHWAWGSGFFFPPHLLNWGNQTGSDQHGCPMPDSLQGCKSSQLTPNAPAWGLCWWSLLPPSPQKKTKTFRKEDKQEIGWQTVWLQVAFKIGPKPLETGKWSQALETSSALKKTPGVTVILGETEEKQRASDRVKALTQGRGYMGPKRWRSSPLCTGTPRDPALLRELVSSTWWCWWNHKTGATSIPQRNVRGL